MAGRKLGGGRILGNGKCLEPAPSTHQRAPELLSFAENQVAQGNSLSLLELSQDLSSAVSQQNGVPSDVVLANTQLYCPICNEEMMTLLQLNRHLDDDHRELPEVQQDEVKTWFDKQVVKAKKFQPLAVINQKLKGLDIFEPNGSQTVSAFVSLPGKRSILLESSSSDNDEIVSNAHWQRPGYNDLCTEPSCGKKLGAVSGNINCRKCGRLFCERHTMYQMKLSRSAQHEPLRGFWCRVCETCFKSRHGYSDHNGFERNHTQEFIAIRGKTMDRTYLQVSRLEKRLTKLTQLLVNSQNEISISRGVFSQISGQQNQRKTLEQSVVAWEEDSKASICHLCNQEFGPWLFRRHHCRLCGRVVCADPFTKCSTEISFNVAAKKSTDYLNLDIRICRTCQSIVFSKKDFDTEVSHKPIDQRAYENLIEFEKGIRLLLPKFQRLLFAIQNPQNSAPQVQLAEAAKVRKRLIDSFGKYDLAAKRIRDLPSDSQTHLRLQKAVYQRSANFLNNNMLPLQSLPKILKHTPPYCSNTQDSVKLEGTVEQDSQDDPSQVSTSFTFSALEEEQKELTEKVIILEEQRFMLSEMLATARESEKLDDQAVLTENIAEIDRECDRLRDVLGQLEAENLVDNLTVKN